MSAGAPRDHLHFMHGSSLPACARLLLCTGRLDGDQHVLSHPSKTVEVEGAFNLCEGTFGIPQGLEMWVVQLLSCQAQICTEWVPWPEGVSAA